MFTSRVSFFLTQALLPVLVDGGRIGNLSSGLTRVSAPGWSAYAAAKAAVEVLTMYMAKELGDRKITVNMVPPASSRRTSSVELCETHPRLTSFRRHDYAWSGASASDLFVNCRVADPPRPSDSVGSGVCVTDFDGLLMDCAVRILRLLDAPSAIPVHYSTIMREISYWLLSGPHGGDVVR